MQNMRHALIMVKLAFTRSVAHDLHRCKGQQAQDSHSCCSHCCWRQATLCVIFPGHGQAAAAAAAAGGLIIVFQVGWRGREWQGMAGDGRDAAAAHMN